MLGHRCATYGTGPLGSAGDGCDDTAEYIVLGVLTVAVVGVAWASRAACVVAGAVLASSSVYHVVFGEGTMAAAVRVAKDDSLGHGIVLAVINTREVTVVLTVALIAWFLSWVSCAWKARIAANVYALLAAIAVPVAATLEDAVYLDMFDWVGVATGAFIMAVGVPAT